MFDRNIIARSHFTSGADGMSAFGEFLKSCSLLDEELLYEYEDNTSLKWKNTWWRATSWGGYVNADGRWMIFVAWRNAKMGRVRFVRWYWDDEQQRPVGKRIDDWTE